MSNLGLVIALAARAGQFPSEYELILRIQEATMVESSGQTTIYTKSIDWRPYDFMWWTHHLSTTFGLAMAGSGKKPLPYGYIRLPSIVNDPKYMNKSERLYLARFAPDLKQIRRWAYGS